MSQVGSSSGGIDFGGIGSSVGSLFGAIGDFSEAGGYSQAAKLAKQNAQYVKLSTDIQEQEQQRQGYQVRGATEAAVASSGFSLSGSGMDILKSNMQQVSLNKGLTGLQGNINMNAWLEKAAADSGMASAATAGGIGGLISSGIELAAVLA